MKARIAEIRKLLVANTKAVEIATDAKAHARSVRKEEMAACTKKYMEASQKANQALSRLSGEAYALRSEAREIERLLPDEKPAE